MVRIVSSVMLLLFLCAVLVGAISLAAWAAVYAVKMLMNEIRDFWEEDA